MQLPIVAPAPLVTAHADVFRDLFENRCQFQHFQNYLTGLIVLDNKSWTTQAWRTSPAVCSRVLIKPTSPASSLKRRGSKTASMTVGSCICSSRHRQGAGRR